MSIPFASESVEQRFAEAYAAGPHGTFVGRQSRLPASGITLTEVAQPRGSYRTPGTGDLVFGLVRSAPVSARMDFGAGAFGFEAGVTPLFLSPAGVESSVEVRDPHFATLISWPWRRLDALLEELGDGDPGDLAPLAATGFRSPLIALALDLFWDLASDPQPPAVLLEDSAAVILAAELRRLAGHSSGTARLAMGGLSPGRLRRAQTLMIDHMAHPLGLREVAEHVGMSQFHFWRCFHLSVGCSPHRWLLRVRLERACELLKTSRLTVTEIAFQVGYQTSQAFSRAFSQEMGCTPAQYRFQATL